jgi:bis(5'-nucleosyl)-tetraphosphatase (symmetrical)
MATYAIGDVQGCYDQLRRLLDKAAFERGRDTLWFVGDLVNRGPHSLQVLRFVKSLGDRAITVLGNHDLHLLAVAEGVKKPHRGDTLDEILDAPDRDDLLEWLRHRKMMHAEGGYAMVHAGLLPQWSIARALELAREVEAALRGADYHQLMRHLYGNEPARWQDTLSGHDRSRVIINAMTRLRLCSAEGDMEFSHKTGLEHLPPGFMPWYEVPGRASLEIPVIFGHWAALGLVTRSNVFAIDTGCVWGRSLSALRLEDRQVMQCDCSGMKGIAPEQ